MPLASLEANGLPRLFPITQDHFGDDLGALLGSGVTIGAMVAIAMTLLLEAMSTRRQRLEVALDMAALRLLRYHASAVRHQKYQGVDIVAVQVEGSASSFHVRPGGVRA